MLALTHLALALLLIRWFDLDRDAAFATLLFGVFIDFDHTFGIVDFWAREGVGNAFNVEAAWATDIQWKSLLHSPQGILFVAPVTFAFRMALPLVAWGLHLVMDHVQIYYLGVFSPVEMVLLALIGLALLHLERSEHEALTGDSSLRGLLEWEAERALSFLGSLPLVSTIRKWKGPRGTSS